jgi:hypothetical protein
MTKPKKISTVTAPPPGTKAAGRRLWDDLLADYELDEHELALLREAVRTVDLLDALARIVADEGPMVDTPAGPRVHPAAVEARQQRLTLARLLASLRLPAGESGDEKEGTRRPQRRSGLRGVYGIRGGSTA